MGAHHRIIYRIFKNLEFYLKLKFLQNNSNTKHFSRNHHKSCGTGV